MNPNSARTRAVVFAHMFGPPRPVKRDEASKVYASVCDALSQDDLVFRYATTEAHGPSAPPGFAIRLERKEGRGGFAAVVEWKPTDPAIKLLMEYTWSPSTPHVTEWFDSTAEAILDALEGEWRKVLAEVRIRAQCNVRGDNALQYMRDRVLRFSSEWLDGFGEPLTFASAKFQSPSRQTIDSLEGPMRELSIETLNEDPRGLYLELMSQWSQVPQPAREGQSIDLSVLRQFDKKPSDYVQDADSFLKERLNELARLEKE